MPRSQPLKLLWPLEGVVESLGYAAPRRLALPRSDHALNVRPFDALEDRVRGGQRPGTSKYIAAVINTGKAIQCLAAGIQVASNDPTAAYTLNVSDWTGGEDVDDQTNWEEFHYETSGTTGFLKDPASNVISIAAAHIADAYDTYCRSDADYVVYGTALAHYTGTAGPTGTKYAVKVVIDPPASAATQNDCGAIFLALRLDKVGLAAGTKPADCLLVGWRAAVNDAGEQTVDVVWSNSGRVASSGAGERALGSHTVTPGTAVVMEVRVSGDEFSVYFDDNFFASFTSTLHPSNLGVGVVTRAGGADTNSGWWSDFTIYDRSEVGNIRDPSLLVVSGGNIYRGSITDGMAVVPNGAGGTGQMHASDPVQAVQLFDDVFFCDGLFANYNYVDLSASSVVDWTGAIGPGSLPRGTSDNTLGCTMICLYRGRIVMAGLAEERQNWFMSRANAPLDWDYSPATTDALQAVAGNNTNAGEVPDIVTCLIPYLDDLLFFGGDHTLWVLRGDAASGGRIDNVSRQVGIIGPRAWTQDSRGVLYFMGQDGLYRLSPSSAEPELLSQGRLDSTFRGIDTTTTRVILIYDRERHGIHIWLSPIDAPGTGAIHWWWDQRTNGFWPQQYPGAHGPTTGYLYDADDPTDQALLLGGYDSYVRKVDASVYNDDGTAIDSYVKLPALAAGSPRQQIQMDELQVHLDADGSGATLDVYRGATPEAAAVSATSVLNATLVAGRNLPLVKKVTGNTLVVKLRNNTVGETWAFEEAEAEVSPGGRQRASL